MDRRDREQLYDKWYKHFDEARSILTIEYYDVDSEDECEAELPAKFDVCGLCDGKGKHVNPSVDAHGISSEEFLDDPDFKEAYFGGMYDVSCYRCGGKRVEPVVNEDALTPEQKKLWEKIQNWQAEVAHDRWCDYQTMRGESGYCG